MTAYLLMVLLMTTTPSTQTPVKLPACPSSPNCVSSQAEGSRFMEPLRFSGDPQQAFARLGEILRRRGDASIVSDDGRTLQIEFRTFLGFIDDALFVLDPVNTVIHVRSAARVGYWDIGKNRRRIEDLILPIRRGRSGQGS